MDFDIWIKFFIACWVISISPGAGAVSCMTVGMRFGYRLGVWNIAGLITGIMFVLAIVATGLGAVLSTSKLAFETIKWFGVAYLVYLGVQQWRSPTTAIQLDEGEMSASIKALFWKGFLVNASNPKGIVFMLAVLPQFIRVEQPQLPQYLVAGASLVFTDFVIMSLYTLLAARVLTPLKSPTQIRWLNRTFGSLFIGAGALLAGFKRAA
jgi:homoserine/homoserine lactone efflux protein